MQRPRARGHDIREHLNGPGSFGAGQGMAAAGPRCGSMLTVAEPLPGSRLSLVTPPGASHPTDLFLTRVKRDEGDMDSWAFALTSKVRVS